MSGLNFLDGDSTFSLVNTWYAKHDGEYNMFYIYKKNQNVIVFRELLSVDGVADYEVVYKGNIFELKEDPKIESTKQTSLVSENKEIVFISNYNSNNKIELMINGEDVVLMEYENSMRVRSSKGKLVNGKLYIDSDLSDGISYHLEGNNLCIKEEGNYDENCYTKISENTNGTKMTYSNELHNTNSLSDIRSLVISGNLRNMKRQLGKPDDISSADDFMLKYYNWKPFSVYSSQRLLYSVIYEYENICDRPIIVIYNSNNAKVFEVMYKDDVTSFEDLAVDYGYD
jgi:hypothetical protein